MNRPYDPCPAWCTDPHPPHAHSVTPAGQAIRVHSRDLGPWVIEAVEDEHGHLAPARLAWLQGDDPLTLDDARSAAADLREAITRLQRIEAGQ